MKENYLKEAFSIFSNENLGSVRVMESETGEPWFIGQDIAKVLGIKNPADAYRRLEDDEKKNVMLIDKSDSENFLGKRAQRAVLVSESGMYGMLMTSRKKEAREFQRWITHDVLPSIRKNGGYIIAQEQLPQKERIKLEEQIRTLAEKTAKMKNNNKILKASNERLQKRRHELIRENKGLKETGKHMKKEIGKREELLDIYEKLSDKQINEYEQLRNENRDLKEKLADAAGVSKKAPQKNEAKAKQEYFVSADGLLFATREEVIRDRMGR